jgi:deoxycytidine triphosphate deaminase
MKGVLPHQEIVPLIGNAILGGDQAFVRTASYDMRIGDEYYLYDEKCPDGTAIRKRGQGVIVIPPNGLLLCTMMETLKLPADIVGHLSLKVGLLMKGIIIANQSQIDAGYEGRIFGLLYNLSQRAVCLKDGEFVLRLELVRLEGKTDAPYNNSTSKGASLSTFIDAPLISSLVEIRRVAEGAVDDVKKAQDSLASAKTVGAVLAVIATALLGLHFAPVSKLEDLANKVSGLDTKFQVYQAGVPSISRIQDLERKNLALEDKMSQMEAILAGKTPHDAKPVGQENRPPPAPGASQESSRVPAKVGTTGGK